jgi:DNA repair ATPase RecN/DNA repair exonuclease SbcCD nuclease subunit
MKFLVTADHHIGNHGRFGGAQRGGLNTRARLTLAVTRASHALARELGADVHLVCGDLFDTSRPTPAMLAHTQRIFSLAPESIVLLGNHDYHSGEADDHAISPLVLPSVTLVTEPRVLQLEGAELWVVPYTVIDGKGPAERLEETLLQLAAGRTYLPERPRVLALHMGIGDDATPEFLRLTTGWVPEDDLQVAASQYHFKFIVAGDWHEPRLWLPHLRGRNSVRAEATVVQCGTICPTGFRDHGFDVGYAWLIDTETGEVTKHQVPGPRFVSLASIDDLQLDDGAGQVFVEVSAPLDRVTTERAQIKQLVESKTIQGGNVRVDRREIEQGTKRAAARARDRSEILVAARDYVAALPLEPEADRVIVQDLVQTHLRNASAKASTVAPRSVSVTSIRVQNWARYDAEQVMTLPIKGLCVISGENGEGKSALIEAVSGALWGQTIRDHGKGPWRDVKDPSRASVQLLDGSSVTRERVRGKLALHLRAPDGTHERHATATKGQTTLDSLVGPFSTWRSSCVFHAASATARFAGATDGERKRLIDQLMGTDVFDAASKSIRAELAPAEAALAAGARRIAEAEVAREQARQGVKQTRQLMETQESVAAPALGPEPAEPETERAELAKLTEQHAELEQRVREIIQARRDLASKIGEAEGRIKDADRRAKALAGKEACPLCEQGVPDHMHGKVKGLRTQAANTLAEHTAKDTELEREHKTISSRQAKLTNAMRDLERRISTREHERREYSRAQDRWDESAKRLKKAHEALRVQLQSYQFKLAEADQQIIEAEDAGAELISRVAALRSADKALGLTGVRATVTGELLSSIEQLANYWLELINPDLHVEIRPFRELANGAQRDEISLLVRGAGGVAGSYHDASTGQQRRVDLALMLALSEVVGGEVASRSTLFFDEVFGALDLKGCQAVAKVLRELAQDRCVVVLTHVEQLAEDLAADVHVHVASGELRSRRR